MKDNNKNLSNALSNEAAESVAGGKLSGWTTKKREKMVWYFGYKKAMEIMDSVGPTTFAINVRKSPIYTADQKKEILSMLGRKA